MFDPKTLIGYIVNGQYRLASLCGTGSYGWVYAADEVAFGEVIGQVAVKLLRPPDEDARKAVIREVKALRQLTHPNLLSCHAAGEVTDGLASGCLYIATELASETLEARLKSAQRMTPDDVREMVEHVASALAYLSERGAVHRDVKPANILRVGNVWKLGDFGLVRGVEGTATQTASPKGTALYMSPEALDRETGPFVDAWALGVVIQECLTGTMPYSPGSEPQVIAQVLAREPSISSALDEPFASIVRGCLVRNRSRRWHCRQVVEALRTQRTPPVTVSASPARRTETPTSETATPSPPSAPRRFTDARPPAEADHGDVWVNPKDGAELVHVPAGEFLMGSTEEEIDAILRDNHDLKQADFDNEMPQRRVFIRAFWICCHHVTVAQYRWFCQKTNREMPPPPVRGWVDNHPMVNVAWLDAAAYVLWIGAKLPSEAQWEKAARGTDGRQWPWGDTFEQSNLSSAGKEGGPSNVGSRPSGASPYGCLDMAGNVWDWCWDWYNPLYYKRAPIVDPWGPQYGNDKVVKGGSYYLRSRPHQYRCAKRDHLPPATRSHGDGGFRYVLFEGASASEVTGMCPQCGASLATWKDGTRGCCSKCYHSLR